MSLSLFISKTKAELTPDEKIATAIYKNSSPAVVNITTTTLIRDFFSVYPQKGSGSGSIIGPQGYILTNYHVIENANEINVTLTNGKKYSAELIGIAPENDIAIIKIDAKEENLVSIELEDSSTVEVGQKIFAIGNPFGLNSTMTTGIISALGRPLATENGKVIENVLQIDAPINPGNSGGPLIATNGKMIGINTAIFSPSGGNIGIGFAIPVSNVKELIPELIRYGKIRRPWFGIEGIQLWNKFSQIFNLPVSEGVMISSVIKGSPAYKAGVKGGVSPIQISGAIVYLGGDILLEIDGKKISSMTDINKALADKKENDTVKLKLLRDRKIIYLNMKVELRA
ncbi:DegP2 peptidase [Candidatus Magnetoovum chiemensis]|nr:DegP2 peptidase [Candidatus Magnetoovum chiemensis]